MSSWNPAESPATNTLSTLVLIQPSWSGTYPPSSDLKVRSHPRRLRSSTLGTRPMARQTVSAAMTLSEPATGSQLSSILTSITDSMSLALPRAALTVCEL